MADYGTIKMQADNETPSATVAAEVSQTAAGIWRGSVKVTVSAPITFDTYVDYTRTFGEAEAVIKEVEGGLAAHGGFPEIELSSIVESCEYQNPDTPSVFVSTPSGSELSLRHVVNRLLSDSAASVAALVHVYNTKEEVEIKEKKGK